MNSNKLEVELVYNSKNLKIDIKDYIEKNSDFLKNEFLKFCKNLENKKLNNKFFYELFETRNNHNLWEMSLIKEKSNFKSDNIFKAILFLAIKKIISENKLKKIIFYNIPIEENLIRQYLENKKIFYEFLNVRKKKKTIKSFLSNFFLIRFVYYFLALIIKLFIELKKNKFIDNDSNFVIFSYFAHFKNKKNNKIVFNQYGNLQKVLEKKFKLDNQYIFVPNKNNLKIDTLQNKHSILNTNVNFKNKIFIMYNFLFYSFKFFFIKKLIFIKLKDCEFIFVSYFF
jgi:surface carbohydrate biosynthesis protein (TIGR04326 family)